MNEEADEDCHTLISYLAALMIKEKKRNPLNINSHVRQNSLKSLHDAETADL